MTPPKHPHDADDDAEVIDITGLIPDPTADTPITPDDIDGQIAMTINRLLTGISDPHVRYQVAHGVKGQLAWVMAVSAQQMIQNLGSVQAAAEKLGKSRQYLTRLLTENQQPTPRAAAKAEPTPARHYGELLALYEYIAERRDQHSGGREARNEYEKLERNAIAATTVRPALDAATQRWMKRLPAPTRDSLRQRLTDARQAVGELPAYLNLQQQGDVILGLDSARAARRKQPHNAR